MTNPDDPINMAVGENGTIWSYAGLTKREYFAAMAMQGIVSNGQMIDTTSWNWLAENSVLAADALIKALNKTP